MEKYFNQTTSMYNYVRHNKIIKRKVNLENKLICLKDFSSSIPIIKTANSKHLTNGGGFYINLNGIGIALDPGIGFLNQFHNCGGSILDIDVVVVSHNHFDHVADLSGILSLNYDYNLYVDREKKLFPYTKLQEHKLLILCDNITYKKYVSEATDKIEFKKISEISDGYNCNRKHVDQVITIRKLQVKHDETIDTYALKFETQSICIGYTSDAEYSEELNEFIKKCEIAILNISEPSSLDLKGNLKGNHLGYTGIKSLILSATNRYNLISEFCCLRGDNRIELTKRLKDETKSKTVYPVSSGVVFDLERKNFCCSQCGLIVRDKPLVIRSKDNDSLLYICESCML